MARPEMRSVPAPAIWRAPPHCAAPAEENLARKSSWLAAMRLAPQKLIAAPVPVKAALNLSGFRVGKPRLPLVEATAKEQEQIQTVLKELALVAV